MDSTLAIKITPSPSSESFETASPAYTEWELTPYRFTNPPLQSTTSMGQDSGDSFDEIATVRLPHYHLLVDHALGVAWKSFCNQRKHIGQMAPEQLIWAIKVIESHRSRHSQYSEDMVIQYLQEIVLAMSTGGLQISSDNPEESGKDLSSMPLEVAAPLDDSFVLANMTPRSPAEVPVSFLTPAAASTPLMIRTSGKTPTAGASGNELVESLKSLQDMLVHWKKRQMRWIKINVEQLEAIEQMLTSTGTGEDQTGQQLRVTKYTGSNNPSQGRTENANSSRKIKRRSSLNCW